MRVASLRTTANAIVQSVGAIFSDKNVEAYAQVCDQARADAHMRMLHHAATFGANGVIGVRYDANDLLDGATEVLAYGTAVWADWAR